VHLRCRHAHLNPQAVHLIPYKAASYDMILDNFTLTQLSLTTGIAPLGS